MPNYWALASNPKYYRIEDAIKELDQDTWVTKGSKISKGDRVIIWKTQGDSNNRGIICLGEVISDVEIDNDKKNPYWINSDMANEESERVLVHYVHAPNLPLWMGERVDKLLQNLNVAKAAGGAVFKISPRQWDLILDAVGGWPVDNPSYWWVNHAQRFKLEIDGGYIWSPKTKINGASNQTYTNLIKTKPGDIVISHAKTEIRAIGVVTACYKEQKRPSGSTRANIGWVVPIKWFMLDKPISPKLYMSRIAPLLPGQNSPLQKDGSGNQNCYLSSIPDKLGKLIVGLTEYKGSLYPEIIDDIINESQADQEEEYIRSQTIDETEKDQLIKARKGQGKFRLNVEKIENKCRITNISNKNFLIASHIKPWKDCDNSERLDGNNGLLLSPHTDKLFDQGWISFTDSGDILCVDVNVVEVMKAWGLNAKMNVGSFSRSQCKYLSYHRKAIYGKKNKLK